MREFSKLKYFILFACAVLMVTGCATHMPASEGIIFTQVDKLEHDQSSPLDKVSGEAILGVSRIVPLPNLEREARDRYGSDRINSLDDDFLTTLGMPSFAVSYDNRFAIGSTTPLPGFWGLDGTVRLSDKYFLTLSRQMYLDNTQVVLQRKVLSTPTRGLSIGAFYRYDPMQFESEDETRKGSRFYISWFGVRSLYQAANNFDSWINFRGMLNAGYVPEYKSAIITFGISINVTFLDDDKRGSLPPPPDF